MVVTDVGVNEIRDWLAAVSGATAPTHINSGDNNTPALSTDTALINELIRKSTVTQALQNKQVTFSASITATELVGDSLREFGLNNAGTSGDQFTRSTHAVIVKNNNVEIIYEITLRILN